MTRTRRVAGFLQVHAEVDQVYDDLHVPLRLHSTTHHAEGKPRLAVPGDESGNDGVERPLARRVDIGVAIFGANSSPRSCRTKPQPVGVMPEPMPR